MKFSHLKDFLWPRFGLALCHVSGSDQSSQHLLLFKPAHDSGVDISQNFGRRIATQDFGAMLQREFRQVKDQNGITCKTKNQ